MSIPILSAGAHIVVGDGKKALILFNEGTVDHPSLTVELSLSHETPPSRDLGVGKPGRVFASVGPRHAATDETDWHQRSEDAFAHDIIAALVDLSKREKLKKLTLVAPPRSLAELRKALPESFSKLIIAEIAKDLTRHPVPSITALLQAEDSRR